MKRFLFAAVLVLCCLAAGPAWPQDAEKRQDEKKVHEIESLEVRASAELEPPNSPYHLPASSEAAIWSVNQAQIEAMQPRDLFDVLAFAPGVQLSFQGRKGMNFITSRGGGNTIGGTSFAILIDGTYIPWTQSSRVLASFPVDTVESIQVVRDATTLTLAPLSGLGSIGAPILGVVIIKTRKPAKEESEIKAGYGNLNRYKAFLNHGGRPGDGYYSFSYNKLHDDGRDDWNNASDSDSILAKGGYEKYGFKADASFYYDWASREIQRSLPVSATADAKWEYDPLDTLMATLNLAKEWNPAQTTSLGVYTGRVEATNKFRSWSKPQAYSEFDSEDNVVQADLRHIVTTENNNFRAGGQAIFWDTPTGQFYYEGYERKEQLYSGYLYDEYSITRKLSIDGGARVDAKHVSKGVNKYAPTDATPSEIIDDEWADPAYSVAAGLAYRFVPGWEASLRTSFVEQGADTYLFTKDDKSLQPEKQLRYEAGIMGAPHPAFKVSATAFHYDIKDGKVAVGSIKVKDDVYNVYDNADTARSGAEVFVNGYIFIPELTYGAGYSYQRSDNDLDDKAIPHHTVTLQLGYRVGPVSANLMMRYVSDYESNQFAADKLYYEIGDFSRVDANINYDFALGSSQWRATLFGQNLTGEEFQTRLGWEDVGLTYGVELGVKF